MANSIREQILQALSAAMASAAGATGATFIRSPTAPLTREQTPALLLLPELDAVQKRSNMVTDRQLTVTLVAVARQAGRSGTAPELEADALLVAAHTALLASAPLLALVLGITETDTDWDLKTFEVTSAYMPARYAISYRTQRADIATQG